jgi:uncharacterized membrane protein YoaT (DUF817 family)
MSVFDLQHGQEVEYMSYVNKRPKKWKKGKIEITKWGSVIVTIGIKGHIWAKFSTDWYVGNGKFYYLCDDGKKSYTLEIKEI